MLRAHKDEWAQLPIPQRIDLLRRCVYGYLDTAPEVVAEGCRAKGLDRSSSLGGEEWMAGPVQVLRNLRLLIESLSQIQQRGVPFVAADAVGRTPTGELSVRVFPATGFDRFMYARTSIDVWMQREVDEATLPQSMANAYRVPQGEGTVALVLSAGNVASIGPMDVLYKMFVEKRVAIIKMHPVNAYLGPLLERAFEPLIARGYLRVVYGGAAEGQHLVHHAGVDEVHMTGSTVVHDRIVWGDTPEEQASRRAEAMPRLTKPITSELGCVTPIIVVPGTWSDAELHYQAANVATMVAHSASCTCTSAKVLITWRGWEQRQALLNRIDRVLSGYPARAAYYPGAATRYETFMRTHPGSREVYPAEPDRLAPATIYGIDATESDIAFREEAWSPILAETNIEAADEGEFLQAAVRFCNDRLFGTLSAGLIVHPASRLHLGLHFDRAVAALRYGTIAINHWSAVSFGLAVAPWGAYPGHTLGDVGSGIGFVHNTLMFDRPLKTVLTGPFLSRKPPPWFVTHRHAHVVGRRMAGFEASPSWWRLPAIAAAAIRD